MGAGPERTRCCLRLGVQGAARDIAPVSARAQAQVRHPPAPAQELLLRAFAAQPRFPCSRHRHAFVGRRALLAGTEAVRWAMPRKRDGLARGDGSVSWKRASDTHVSGCECATWQGGPFCLHYAFAGARMGGMA